MTKQQTIDALVVKFSVLSENLRNVKEAIATGTLNDAIKEAKQLAYSSQTFLAHLEELKKQQKPAPTMSEALALSIR
jgi:hypothetical protein